MDGGGGHNGYNGGGYDMTGNPIVNGGTPPMPTPPLPPAHEPQHHYGRGRGGRPRGGGYGQSYAHQQHSQSFPSQYSSPQWQQQQPFYPQQNGAYNPYAAQPYNPYLNNNAYYNQQYYNNPYYAPGPGYPNYIPAQPSAMYGAQAHQSPYQQSQYAGNPQQPIANGPHSPFSQPHLPTGQPIHTAVPNVPLTPASVHSSQFVPAPPTEPVQPPAPQAAESVTHFPQDDQAVNGNDIVEYEAPQQPLPSSPLEASSPSSSEIPTPNPKFSFHQVPFYTDPDSTHIFTTQKRSKKRFRPIEGHDVTMQASQPGPTETSAAEPSIDDPATVGNAPGSSVTGTETIPTDKAASDVPATSNLATPQAANANPQDSSPATVSTELPKKESPAAPTADSTTGESKLESDKDGNNGIGESSGGEPAFPAAKPEAIPQRPKTWAQLLKKDPVATKPAADAQAAATNGAGEHQPSGAPGTSHSSTRALADVLRTYEPSKGKAIFIEPRGLYNARVDCYMISILQALLYCAPFYRFLHQVKTQSAQSLKSSTPLLDALIDFQGNFRVIKSADSPKQLRESLTPEQHRQYGETLHANSVFDAAFRSPAIKNLERGKQQDAEEFLILLLGALSDECVKVIGAAAGDLTSHASVSNDGAANDWKTVEKNGKPAVTQSSGLPELPNPVSKIFKGKMRSEVRFKSQVTNTDQPFTNLKLHIEDQSIRSISDALHRFNAAENVTVNDKAAQGTAPVKYQQTFIHKLPYILVIHLVRFESTGTSWAKNGKHVDYPLELEIPSPILSKPARIEYADARKYRLISVVYHHGSDKDSGHYSIDVRRQDDESWLRINDTQVTAIDSSDVVGSDKNASNKPATGGRKDTSADGVSNNRFAAMSDNAEGGAWQNVGASGNGGKKNSNVGNGKSSGASTPRGTPIKDNKVAYLLFYQKLK